MARTRQAGALWVPAKLDLKEFRQQLKVDLPKESRSHGEGVAKAIGEGLRQELNKSVGQARQDLSKGLIKEEELKKKSRDAARAFLGGLDQEFKARMGSLREALARGLISRDEFRRLSNDAKREFNNAVLPAIQDLRRAGEEGTETYQRLQRALKSVGDEAKKAGSQGERSMGLVGRAVANLKASLKGLLAGFVAIFAVDRIRRWGEELIRFARQMHDDATRQLAVWQANAGHVGRTFEEIQRFSRQMQRETFFTSSEIDLAIAQLLTYKSIQEDVFERTIRLGGDMASVFGGIERSVEALARALDDPIAGLGMLRKMGFTFEDDVREQVRLLTEQNRVYEAQVMILDALESEVSGVARAMKTGWPAVLDNVGKKWERLKYWLAETVAVPVVGFVLGVTDALLELEDPLDRSIEQLRRFSEATEAIAVAQLSERVFRLRDEIRALREETETAQFVVGSGAIVRRGAGGHETIDIGRMSAAQLDRTITESRRALMQAEVDLADARERGDRIAQRTANAERRRLQTQIDLLEEFRRKREQLEVKTEELREAEEALGEARERFDLRRQRTALAERIEELQNAGSQLTPLIDHLQKELERLDQALQPKERERPPAMPTEEEVKEGEKALKALSTAMAEYVLAGELGLRDLAGASNDVRAALRELLSVQQQIEAVEQQIADIRKAGLEVPPGAEEYLRWLREVRDAAREAAKEVIDRWQRELPAVTTDLAVSIQRIQEPLNEVERLTRNVTQAEQELTRARLAGDPERISRAEKKLADTRKALRDHVGRMIQDLERSDMPAKELQKNVEILVALLDEAGVKLEETKEGFDGFATSLVGVARGVLSVADAMGVLDDDTRRALQGVIDLFEGLRAVAANPANIGGWAQAIGGVVGLVSSAFDRSAEREAERRRLDATIQNTKALERLRETVLQSISVAERESLVTGARGLLGPLGELFEGIDDLPAKYRDSVIRGLVGSFDQATLQMLEEIESLTGVDFFDLRSGTFDFEEFKRAVEALEEADLGGFADTVSGQLDALHFILRALGDDAGTAAERLERFLGAIRKFAPQFAAEIERIMAEEGPDAALAWVQTLAEAFAAEGLDSELIRAVFGDQLTAEEVRRIIEEGLSFVRGDGAGGFTAGGEAETRLAVGITEVQANQLLAIQSSQLFELRAIRALIAGGALPAVPIQAVSGPSAGELSALLARMGGGGAGAGLQITIQDLAVQIGLSGDGSLSPADVEDAGYRAGVAAAEGFAERLAAIRRAGGHLAPPRVMVE